MAYIGHLSLWLVLFASAYCALASAWGAYKRESKWVERAKNSLLAATNLIFLATAILLYLLLSHDFQVQYVYAHTNSYQPTLYVFSALWAGQEGSFLLWALLYSAVAALAIKQRQHLPGNIWPHMLAILAMVLFFFALLLVTVQNPFTLYPIRPTEGVGILPALENPGMVIHPPILFLGYAAYGVPFAFTMASLFTGQVLNTGLSWLRKWGLIAWLFLGLGILIGAWWAYVELGWGGYWAWDPVESASLIPWLTGTAYLHLLLAQEHRAIFKRWTAALAIATFLLCFFSTLVTRGGIIISDLHGFAQSIQPVAYYLIGFILTVAALSAILFHLRRQLLRDEQEIEQ
ncbi:MAG: cytochrome c biogenesis protein CcsA, partial [Chloroflexi bacterium]|nr:cytochrome c biogenesis protein CcsA [Chloroflexota bacterium]